MGTRVYLQSDHRFFRNSRTDFVAIWTIGWLTHGRDILAYRLHGGDHVCAAEIQRGRQQSPAEADDVYHAAVLFLPV